MRYVHTLEIVTSIERFAGLFFSSSSTETATSVGLVSSSVGMLLDGSIEYVGADVGRQI